MSKVFHNLHVSLDEDLEEKLEWLMPRYSAYRIQRQSTDARKRRQAPHFVYSVEVFAEGESPTIETFEVEKIRYSGPPVLIVGAGPAGLFAALRLSERGVPCHLFEQGSEAGKRLKAINRFWRHGEIDPHNNVGFGEGGAGLYSDGKLITRIKSPFIPYVMDRLIRFGAPEEIRFLADPHVGSDRIRRLIPVMRKTLLQNGVGIHFDCKVSEILTSGQSVRGLRLSDGREFLSDRVILACGHSAEDTFEHLASLGVHMEGKSFAVGLRVEHPQKLINQLQYREFAEHPKLGSANYKLAHTDPESKIGVYSFCMCPGGYVLSSATGPGGVVSNGMSNYHRNSAFANAAVVVTVDYEKTFGSALFAGLRWRRELERKALAQVVQAGGTKQLPVQRVEDFLNNRLGPALESSCPSGVIATRLDQLLPEAISKALGDGLLRFEKWMRGFIHPSAQFHGVESRTSCPLRITRDSKTYQSVSHRGLYPTGEGAGYAGGITSAACDGIAVAEAIAAHPG